MAEQPFNYAQARAFAAQYGLVIGLMWIASFACAIYSADHQILGHAGNLIALLSFFVAVRLLSGFCQISPLGGLRKWWMAWLTSIYAALITTMAQYLYFRFLDRGHLYSSISSMMENPEYRQIIESMLPDQDVEALTEGLAQMGAGELTLQLLLLNISIAMVFSLICVLFVRNKTPQHDTTDQT